MSKLMEQRLCSGRAGPRRASDTGSTRRHSCISAVFVLPFMSSQDLTCLSQAEDVAAKVAGKRHQRPLVLAAWQLPPAAQREVSRAKYLARPARYQPAIMYRDTRVPGGGPLPRCALCITHLQLPVQHTWATSPGRCCPAGPLRDQSAPASAHLPPIPRLQHEGLCQAACLTDCLTGRLAACHGSLLH